MIDGSRVLADERHERIARLVAARGSIRIGELAETFGVTEPTIRKDLTTLHERRLLKRTHGGAMALRPLVERELGERAAANAEAKHAIASACVNLIDDGDAVFLDSGTTVLHIAEELAARARGMAERNLTVLTNSLGVVQVVADVPGIEHVLLGGRLRRVGGCLVGPLTVAALERFTVNLAFIGVSGLSRDGISVADVEEAQLKATAIDHAHRTVVPLDHTKVGARHFARVCGLGAIGAVVIDRVTEEARDLCTEHGVEIEEAAPQPSKRGGASESPA